MSGSGGGGWSPPTDDDRKKIDDAKDKEQDRLVSNTNDYLNELLAMYNARDREAIREYIDELRNLLEDVVEIDDILYAGSIEKHTDINELSDVDALVFLDPEEYISKAPKDVLQQFKDVLVEKLGHEKIWAGNLAVTIERKDGTEIQLLPAIKHGNKIDIPSDDGKTWNRTNPKEFTQKLTTANKEMSQKLVPAIKLFKAINDGFPKSKQLSGYHIEAMAVEASKTHSDSNTPRDMLLHLLGFASTRVLKPIKDSTGQSEKVDSYLDNNQRQGISKQLQNTKQYLEKSTRLASWKKIFEE